MAQPPKYRFFLVADTTLEVCPTNWREFQLALSREGYAVNREITTSLRFVNEARAFLKSLYDANGDYSVCTLYFYRRANDWTGVEHGTSTPYSILKADFTTWEDNYPAVSLRFTEMSIREKIEKSKSTDYELPMPYMTDGVLASNAALLSYSGVSLNKVNRFTVTVGDCNQSPNVTSIAKLRSVRSVISQTENYTFPTNNDTTIVAKNATTANIEYSLGDLTLACDGNSQTAIQLVKIHSGAADEIIVGIDQNGVQKAAWWKATPNNNFFSAPIFIDKNIYTASVPLVAGDAIMFRVYFANDVTITKASLCYLKLTTIEASAFQNYKFPIVSHEWVLEQLLNKVTSGFTLQYNIPKQSSTQPRPMLSSGSALYQADEPKLTTSIEKVLKSLKCLYGADVRYDGNTVIVDYPDTFFTETKAADVTPIKSFVATSNNENVYGSVVAGYETDNDTENCLLEFNCKNTFTINKDNDKQLDLVSPYKAGQYTIEKYLANKSEETTKSDQSDNSVFVFVVNGIVNKETTLYRPTLSGSNLPTLSYNYMITPMHILLANGRYLGVSVHNRPKELEFASTDRKADYSFTYAGNSYTLNDGALPSLVALLSNPLFIPMIAEFETSLSVLVVDSSHDNLYKYFAVYDKFSNKTYNVYANDLTLSLCGDNVQQWSALIKSIV